MRFLVAAAGLLSLLASGSSHGRVHTLYRDANGPITAFAQDDSLLAWFAPGRHRCNAVYVLSLNGVRVTLPKPGTSNVTCRWDVGGAPVDLAIASSGGVSALWTLHQRAPVVFDYVLGAALAQPQERRFYQLGHTPAGAGLWLGGIAGSGPTLVYAVTAVAYVNQVACLSGGSCRLRITGGGVHRIVGRTNPLVPGAGPALDVAAAGDRIAYVPAAAVAADGRPVARAGEPIVVRAADTGRLLAEARPKGVPVALALAPDLLAVLERSGRTARVAWYDAGSGARLGAVAVPRSASPELAASDRLVVYRVGRVVRGIDTTTRRVRTIVRTAADPIGLSLAGNRLAWAENVDDRGRISAVLLPGS